jgi:hypothetical protein
MHRRILGPPTLALLAACSSGTGAGAAGSGGSGTTDTTSSTGGVAAVVHACTALASAGTWEDITPPAVKSQLPGPSNCTYGVGAFVTDPQNAGTIVLGTCNMGVWKTTDCGATWTHVNTGKNGGALDSGRQWTFAIDPTDSNVMYTNSGYNAFVQSGSWQNNGVSGAFKSTNGGVDWEVMWPPQDMSFKGVVGYDFVGQVVLDPFDRQHLLITWHASCGAPYNPVCIGESHDAGATWTMVNGRSEWVGGEGQSAYFLDNGHTWLWESQSNGIWRTTDSGATWTQLSTNQAGHGGGQLYRAKDGTFYLAVNEGALRSPDGITWTLVTIDNPMAGLVGDGTTLYISKGFPWNQGQGPAPYQPFWTSPESDGQHWTQMPSPMLSNGGGMLVDPAHHLLYSTDEYAGFWRVVLP